MEMLQEQHAVRTVMPASSATATTTTGAPSACQTGVVKWFNPGKGYGFIAPDAGGDDIFVHISAVQHSGLRKLNEGERVRYAIEQREGRVAAVGLERTN
jgi:CspA family cold shock protein